jgi:hypothetical protein
MSLAETPTPDPRIAELVRVNAELAGEVRRLRLGGEAAPVSGPLPASRRLASLIAERDSLAAQLEATSAELGSIKAESDRLVGHNRELAAEVRRLRGGRLGMARRAWARLRLR